MIEVGLYGLVAVQKNEANRVAWNSADKILGTLDHTPYTVV